MWRPWLTAKVSSEPRLDYFTNRGSEPARTLAPGVYGLSNASLDTPWPKVTRAVTRFACSIASRVDLDMLVRLLENRELARDSELPSTGVPYEWERALSSIQIRANGYGTRASTVITVRNDGLTTFFERTLRHDRSAAFLRPALRVHDRPRGEPGTYQGPGTWLIVRYRAHRMSMCGMPASSYSSPYARVTVLSIKLGGVRLCAEHCVRVAAPLCFVHQDSEQCATDAATARRLRNGHAPDMSVGQQAAGTDCFAARIEGNRVHR